MRFGVSIEHRHPPGMPRAFDQLICPGGISHRWLSFSRVGICHLMGGMARGNLNKLSRNQGSGQTLLFLEKKGLSNLCGVFGGIK